MTSVPIQNISSFENDTTVENIALRKIFWRLIPYIVLIYMLSFIDRVNVSFAAITMSKDLGFSPTVYGFGAGVFFIGFCLFEVPSNLFLEKLGARLWLARIQLTWGILSAAMCFTSGATSFYILRFLLGVAEAGFFPGIVLYLTYWFPKAHRGKVMGAFMLGVPIASVIGAPISGALLGLDQVWGLKGWQWLFILEGLPTVILAIVTFLVLPDRPENSKFLSEAEKRVIVDKLRAEATQQAGGEHVSVWRALINWRTLVLALVYFCITISLHGVNFWLPQIVKTLGVSNLQVGLIAAAPYLFACVGTIAWVKISDQMGERFWNLAVACLAVFIGLTLSALISNPVLSLVAMAIAITGALVAISLFWTLGTAFLAGLAAAGAIANIAALGNLSGFVGPFAMGVLKDLTGSFTGGLIGLAIFPLIAGTIVLGMRWDRSLKASLLQ